LLPGGRLKTFQLPSRFERFLGRSSPLIFTSLVVLMIVHGLILIPLSNGGSDLVDADIPKSLMLLHGQDPYSVQPWASPYPPLLLLVDSGIIWLTGFINPGSAIGIVSQNIRIAGLLADALVGTLIYLYLRKRTSNQLTPLVSAGLFLLLPALSISPLYFFHSDVFGYPMLALSLVAFAARKYLIGSSLLALATVFKIHPILALPLVIIWIARVKNLRAAVSSIITCSVILGLGLALPLAIPGYSQSILGFNLSNEGSGTTLYTTLSIADDVLPRQLQFSLSTFLANQVWIIATLALYTIIIATVWTRAGQLQPVDIVLLGLLAWLVPLKIEYTHYVAWAIVPFLMRGHLKQTIPVLGLLQAADTLSYWSWWPSTSLISGINTVYGLVVAGGIYRVLGLVALGCVFYTIRRRDSVLPVRVDERQASLERNPSEESPLIERI
jgi:lysylphosphatidylglycerol synthetase-like protein (DUF2156 family)